MTFQFAPARREQVSLLIALAGASGSGKTYSALRLAKGLAPTGKIMFIDTEARRGLHYAEQFEFMHADMRPPFRPAAFIEGIRAAEAAGAEVVIIDSFSHEYDGQGGIIDWADELAEGTPKPGITHPRKPNDGDGWKDWLVKPMPSPGNWKEPKGGHKKLMNELLQVRASIIFCLRADEKIAIEREGNKTVVRPLGWMPICEKRFMFEMTASFTLTPDRPGIPNFSLPHKLQSQHRAMFSDQRPIGEDSGAALMAWAAGGTPVSPGNPAPVTSAAALRTPVAGAADEQTAGEYVDRWNTIIEGATNADQLTATWNGQKAERDQIAWPDDGSFKALQAKIKRAIEAMRAPA